MTDQTPHSLPRHTDQGSLKGEHLSVGYGETIILDNVDFHLEPGKLTVLLGPNGCGKSTLLKTLARTLSPRAGRVLLDGQDIHRQSTRTVARQLGVLPQSPNAPDGLSVRELVGLGRFPYQSLVRQWSRRDEAAVTRAMEAADVDRFADRPVDSLSGGQRQRCWIAMVLAQETQWLLLDEPTTFLDLKVQVDLMELLASLCHQHGRTLLVVLHDLNLAAAYADELVLMREGRVRYRGTPLNVFHQQALDDVFGLRAQVMVDPVNGRPFCIPIKGNSQSAPAAVGSSTETVSTP